MSSEEAEMLFTELVETDKDECVDSFHYGSTYHDGKRVIQYAVRACTMCGRKMCGNCVKQGFTCIGQCGSYGCRHCESATTELHCDGCAPKE